MSDETRLLRLINALIDGDISAPDFAELQSILRRNPEARQEYYALLAVDQMLTERYEVPDYVAIHAQAVDNTWAINRFRNRLVAWSLVGAAAILMLTVLTFFSLRQRQPHIPLTGSADSHFLVDGRIQPVGDEPLWKVGQMLEVKQGAVAVALNPYVEACLEGPIRLRLQSRDGKIELLEGKGFFQVAPGGKGFEVHVPGGVIRDIGTKFGVQVFADGTSEVHVGSGRVEIDRRDGKPPTLVQPGTAARWGTKVKLKHQKLDADRFVQSLPWETELFRDDFSEPHGTRMAGKRPDVGQPWMVWREANVSKVTDGKFDTSFGSRALTGGFRPEPIPGRRGVYLVTLHTQTPRNIEDKARFPHAEEDVTIWGRDGAALFSLWASASRGHAWQLKDVKSGTTSKGTHLSALDSHVLTMRYDAANGMVSLHQGTTSQGPLVDKLQTRPGIAPGFLTVSNWNGGDVALNQVAVRVVTYPQKSERED